MKWVFTSNVYEGWNIELKKHVYANIGREFIRWVSLKNKIKCIGLQIMYMYLFVNSIYLIFHLGLYFYFTVIDCTVSEWGVWSECDIPCGTGMMSRNRTILSTQENGGKHCPSLVQKRGCQGLKCHGQRDRRVLRGKCNEMCYFRG